MAVTIYRANAINGGAVNAPTATQRISNQIVASGDTIDIPVQNGIFWLEQLIASADVQIADGTGKEIVAAVSSLDCQISPLRCEYGIKITGAVKFMKGFIGEEQFR